jgi:hypothetical protein
LKYVNEVFTVLKDVCKQKVYSLHDFRQASFPLFLKACLLLLLFEYLRAVSPIYPLLLFRNDNCSLLWERDSNSGGKSFVILLKS